MSTDTIEFAVAMSKYLGIAAQVAGHAGIAAEVAGRATGIQSSCGVEVYRWSTNVEAFIRRDHNISFACVPCVLLQLLIHLPLWALHCSSCSRQTL